MKSLVESKIIVAPVKTDPFNPRLSVELKSSSKPFNCCHEWILEVTRANSPMTDAQIIQLCNFAGFSGQGQDVISREEKPIDAHNKRFVYGVRVVCDSGD